MEEHLEHFQDLKNGSGTHFSGPENVPCDEYYCSFLSLFRCSVKGFLLKPYNPFFQVPVQCERFCIIPVPVPVPVPVPDQASVNTPLILSKLSHVLTNFDRTYYYVKVYYNANVDNM